LYTLAHPWLLILIPLPILWRILTPAHRETRQAIRAPWFRRVADLMGEKPRPGASVPRSRLFERVSSWVFWLLIVLALARPQYLEPPISQVVPTRDLMLLVDLSGSMETQDFKNARGETVDRLSAVKEVLDEFLTHRKGDRVGLIVFGNAAFVQVPFTQDLSTCRLLLSETEVRMAGPRTALGDAIGLGITLFERSGLTERVMIALTDGNDTGSKVPPGQAAKIARDNEITIHVIGVGDPSAAGEEKLDQEALQALAAATHGRYFHAGDRQALQKIYEELDRLDTREVEEITHRPRRELFHWPLAGFMVLSLLFYLPTAFGPKSSNKATSSRGRA
jgi:Ca-activated chloride channel family protein